MSASTFDIIDNNNNNNNRRRSSIMTNEHPSPSYLTTINNDNNNNLNNDNDLNSPSLLLDDDLIMDDSKSDILSTIQTSITSGGIRGSGDGDIADDQSSIEQSQTSLNALDQMTSLTDEVIGKTLVLEIISIILCVLFYLSLLVAFAIRPSFINLAYMLIFFLHNLTPSFYPYFQKIGINRIWMMIPRFTTLSISLLVSISYFIGTIVVSAVTISDSYLTDVLTDIGFMSLKGKDVSFILIHVIPDALVIIFSIICFIILSILWRRRLKLEKEGIPLKIKKVTPSTFKPSFISCNNDNTNNTIIGSSIGVETVKANDLGGVTTIDIGDGNETLYAMQVEDVVTTKVSTSNAKLDDSALKKQQIESIPKVKGATMYMWDLPGVFTKHPKLLTCSVQELKSSITHVGSMPPKKKSEKKHINIHELKLIIFTLFLMFTASFYPSFVGVPYLLLSFLIITLASFGTLKTFVSIGLFIFTQVYSVLLLIFYFLTRFQTNSISSTGIFSKMILQNPYGKMAGFFDIDGNLKSFDYFQKFYTGYVFITLVLITFILSCNFVCQYIAKVLQERELQKQVTKFLTLLPTMISNKEDLDTNSEEYLQDLYYKSEERRLIEIDEHTSMGGIAGGVHTIYESSYKFRMFLYEQLQKFILYALMIALICIILSVPSLCSLPYLLFLYLGMVLSPGPRFETNKVMVVLLPFCFIYSLFYICAQYIFQMPNFASYIPQTTEMSNNEYNPSGSGGVLFYPIQGILYRSIVGTTVGAFLTDVSDSGRSIVLVAVIFGQLILSLFMGLTVRVSAVSKLLKRHKQQTVSTSNTATSSGSNGYQRKAPLVSNDSVNSNRSTSMDIKRKSVYYTNDEDSDLDVVMSPAVGDQTESVFSDSIREPTNVDMTELDKINDEADNNLGEVECEPQNTSKRVWVKIKLVLQTIKIILFDYIWKVLLILFVRNSFYLSLIVCYFADLTSENADLLHAIYLIFCAVYFIFPSFARKTWILLVLYCQFVILALYFFNVWYAPEVVDLPYEIIGFNPSFITIENQISTSSFGVFWKGLIWHIFILTLTSIQYHISNVKTVGNVNVNTSFDQWDMFTKEKNPYLHTFFEKSILVWDKIFLETELLYFLGTLASYFTVFLVIFLQEEASFIGFIFLMIVIACFCLNVLSVHNSYSTKAGYRLFQLFVALWYVFVFYSTLVFVVEYAYQFPSLYAYIQSILPEVERAKQLIRDHELDKSIEIPSYYGFVTPRSIGLYKYQYKNVSLLPFTIIAILTIVQLKYFQFVIARRRQRIKTMKEQEEITKQKEQEQPQQQPHTTGATHIHDRTTSLMDEIVETIHESSHVKLEKQIIFSEQIDSLLLESFLVMKRFCVMHTPKLLIIFLFLASNFNPNIIGLIYLVLVLVFAPAPVIASKIWFLIALYSGFIMTIKYIYQHPFFTNGLCDSALGAIVQHQVENFGRSTGVCTWLGYIGLEDARATSGHHIGNVLWSSLLVFVASLIQKVTYRWERSMKSRGLYDEGCLFIEAEIDVKSKDPMASSQKLRPSSSADKRKSKARNRNTIYISREEFEKMNFDEDHPTDLTEEENFKSFYKRKMIKFLRKLFSSFKYYCNHFYDDYGFEISLFTLLLGSLSLIQTLWGFIYLIVFGVCFFTGKNSKILRRGWIFLVMVVEINMLILFFFRLQIVRSMQFYEVMMNIPIFSKYIILNLTASTGGVISNTYIVAILYLMMFFMALQARVFFKGMYARLQHIEVSQPEKLPKRERGEIVSSFLARTQKLDNGLIVQLDTSSLIKRNIETGKIQKIKDFTTPDQQKKLWNWIKLVVYRFFCFVVLIVMFIDAAIDSNVIKLGQMILCLFYLNLFNRLYWKTVPFWRGIGIFYYITFVIDAIYQIPIVLLGDPINWGNENDTSGWVKNVCLLFGLKARGLESFTTEIIVVCLYYIQIILFESEDYIHFINLLYRESQERSIKYRRNQAYRAAQILSRFAEELFSEKRRDANRQALRSFHEVNKDSDFQSFYNRKHMLKEEYEKVVNTYAKNSEKIERERAILALAMSDLLDLENKESVKIRKKIVSNLNKEEQLMKKCLKKAEHKFQKKMREVVSTLENLQNYKNSNLVVDNSAKRRPVHFERGQLDLPSDPNQEFLPSNISKEEVQKVMKNILSKIVPHDRIVALGDVLGAPSSKLEQQLNIISKHARNDSVNEALSKVIQQVAPETAREGTQENKKEEEVTPKLPILFKAKSLLAVVFANVGHYIYMFTDLIVNRIQIFIGIAWMDELEIKKKYRVNLDEIIADAINEYIEEKEEEWKKQNETTTGTLVELEQTEVPAEDEIKLTEDKKEEEKEEVAVNIPDLKSKELTNQELNDLLQLKLEQAKVHPDLKKKPFNWVPIALKLKQLLVALTKLFFSNTDVICYFAMLVNLLYAPTYFNTAFTFFSLTYAAMQYPYPHRYFWELMLILAQLLISVQYVLYLVQSGLPDNLKSTESDPAIFLLGWQPSTALLSDIVVYLLIMLAIFFHREITRNRGEWKTNSRKKRLSAAVLASANQENNTEQPSTNPIITTTNTSGTITTGNNEGEDLLPSNSQLVSTGRNRANTTTSVELVTNDITTATPRPSNATATNNEEKKESKKTVKFNVLEDEKKGKKDKSEKPNIFRRGLSKFVNHFKGLTNDQFKLGIDYYVVTVAVEILAFVFFFFSFSSMSGRAADETLGAIKSNELSGTFVIILFLFFIEICIERVLYLFATATGKVVFHFLLVLIYHIVYIAFFVEVSRNQNSVGLVLLKILFFIKCVYLFLSCLQIRTGYPKRRYTQFFTRSYYYIAQYVYLVYRAIPFVFELKTLLDWTFIDTTLTFYEYLKLEDVYSQLYKRKCDLEYKMLQAKGFGNRIFLTTKSTSGFLLFIVFAMIIFFPLLFYSTANPALSYNTVNSIQFSIGIEGFEPFYQNEYFKVNPEKSLETFVDFFDGNGLKLFPNYDPTFWIQNFTLAPYSERYWLISTPSRVSMVEALGNETLALNLTMSLTVKRSGPSTQLELETRQSIVLNTWKRKQLANMINYNVSKVNSENLKESIDIPLSYNPYMMNKYSALATATVMESRYLPNCSLTVTNVYNASKTELVHNPPGFVSCSQPTKFYPLEKSGNLKSTTGGPFFFIQSTNIVAADSVISAISSFGIITFYTSFVLAVAQFVRLYSSNLVGRITFEDLDNVDLILCYCQDIYKAREDKDLAMEETMFVNLLRIFRSTELLQIWTRDAKKNWI